MCSKLISQNVFTVVTLTENNSENESENETENEDENGEMISEYENESETEIKKILNHREYMKSMESRKVGKEVVIEGEKGRAKSRTKSFFFALSDEKKFENKSVKSNFFEKSVKSGIEQNNLSNSCFVFLKFNPPELYDETSENR